MYFVLSVKSNVKYFFSVIISFTVLSFLLFTNLIYSPDNPVADIIKKSQEI